MLVVALEQLLQLWNPVITPNTDVPICGGRMTRAQVDLLPSTILHYPDIYQIV